MKVLVYGSGAFGLALANVLADNKHDVSIYARNIDETTEINSLHTNKKYLGDLSLNKDIKAVNGLDSINLFDCILIAVPSKAIKEVIEILNEKISGNKLIINATKGLEPSTNSRIQNYIINNLKKDNLNYELGSILGPGFAKGIVNRELTCVASVSKDEEVAKKIQHLFSNNYFRVYVTQDVIGAEYASSIKNAIAIASGVLKGLGYNENSKAALITRGLVEMCKFGLSFGAEKETFYGLSGVGDLILTCNSSDSRNFNFGYKIGLMDDANEVLKNNTTTVEGIYTINVIYSLSKKHNIDMPIIEALYKILNENKKPSKVVKSIMTRPLKAENLNM